jgi:hypothetical protein
VASGLALPQRSSLVPFWRSYRAIKLIDFVIPGSLTGSWHLISTNFSYFLFDLAQRISNRGAIAKESGW